MGKKKKLMKAQNEYQELLERYEEMHDYLLNLINDNEQAEEELRYLKDFITYKTLDEEYRHFRKYAHEDEDSELPFPNLVL